VKPETLKPDIADGICEISTESAHVLHQI